MSTANVSPTISRLQPLEGLRGLMAWWVVVGHLLFLFSERLGTLSANGAAVQVFIILSGFVISHLLHSKQEAYGPFIVRRWWRLFPAFAVVLVLAAVTLAWQQTGLMSNPFADATAAKQQFRLELLHTAQTAWWPHMLAHITMLHGAVPTHVLPHAAYTFVGAAWSISVEWQFYLVFPLFYWLFKRKAWGWLALSLLVLVALSALPGLDGSFLPRALPWFVVGITSYAVWRNREAAWLAPYKALISQALPWLGLAGLVLPFISIKLLGLTVWGLVWVVLMRQGGYSAATPLAPFYRALAWLMEHPTSQALGKISYSTYLVHMLIMYWLAAALAPLALPAGLWAVCITLGTMLGTLAAAVLMYKYIEAPGIAAGTAWAKYGERR